MSDDQIAWWNKYFLKPEEAMKDCNMKTFPRKKDCFLKHLLPYENVQSTSTQGEATALTALMTKERFGKEVFINTRTGIIILLVQIPDIDF